MIIRLFAWLIYTLVAMAIIAMVMAWVGFAFLVFLDPTVLGDAVAVVLHMVGLGS